MAGDWIKMRSGLQTHPKVVRILSAMRPHDVQTITDKFRVIGGLHAVWCVFDQHSTDGVLCGYTPELLDHVIGLDGLADAMIGVGWMSYDGAETLVLPEFGEHNGQSGKRRAEDQKRKRAARSCPQSVRNLSAEDADENRTREEKRREELTTTSLRSVVERAQPEVCEEQKKPTRRAAQLPADFEPDETANTLAAELGVSLRSELPKFCDYHAARGKPMKDWQAALRTWLRNSKQFAGRAPQQTKQDKDREWLDKLTRRNGDAIDSTARRLD